MSLSWRKRQAQASDQKTWRALGTDSALWKGIEKNSGNVKVALGGTTTEGITTGLKFTHVGNFTNYNADGKGNTVYVSDPSNAALPESGINKFSTPYDGSMNCTGSGLVFDITKFGDPVQIDSTIGEDISGIRYSIMNGGSGYTVGNTFSMGEVPPFSTGFGVIGQITSVASTKIEPGRN